MAETLLDVEDLHVHFATEDGLVRAVDGVSFKLERGKVLGIVGESGSGKSVTSMTILGLTRGVNAKFEGAVRYKDQDLLTMSEAQLRRFRGNEIAMIFQDPMAVSCNPSLLIADEPTTALDVTIQAQIIELIDRLKDDFNSAVILITHDLGVVADVADDIAVMYAGRIVEYGTKRQLFYDPQHPYTWGLLGSIPRLDREKPDRLASIAGAPPSLINLPQGCKFRPRCPHAFAKCIDQPALENRVNDTPPHLDRCWLTVEEKRDLRERTIHGQAAA